VSHCALSSATTIQDPSQSLVHIGRPNSLVEAGQSGSEDDVWLLLTRQDIDVNEEDGYGKTALCHAAADGKVGVAKMLLSRTSVHINSRDGAGLTALSWAEMNGHEAVIKILLETGKVEL
jgi:ankyrin repeat protein